MSSVKVIIKTLSPIHLGSGDADVILDSDVVHDKYGMPVFPGRRIKGLLLESAREVVCMKGLEKYSGLIQRMFDRDCRRDNPLAVTVPDFHLVPDDEYTELCHIFDEMQKKYGSIINPSSVLETFTSIRYQTKMNDGVVENGSFRNMRVVDDGVTFVGNIEADELGDEALELLALTVRNMRSAGMKRNRGFGLISCRMEWEDKLTGDKKTEQNIIEKIFSGEVK